MYQRIEENRRMTENEACLQYPDHYILMQRDESDVFDPVGIVLFIGDNGDELFSLQVSLPVSHGVVIEGLNHRRSLGGIVVGN